MNDFVKQPILWMGLVILVVALIIVSDRFYDAKLSADGIQQDNSSENTSDSALVTTTTSSEINQKAEHANGVVNQHQAGGEEDVRHQDMLSEEMKQAIRDQLFQHGDKRTITRPDGTVIMSSDGRFTQVPVAVEMPDGSIQIKEYSELPK